MEHNDEESSCEKRETGENDDEAARVVFVHGCSPI